MLAEDGAGLDVRQIILLLEQFALSPLAAAVGAENENVHRNLLGN